jgi:hypothetical protein
MYESINLKWTILAVIAIGAFWWTSVRPYMDRKHCNEYAAKQVEAMGSPNDDRPFELYGRNYTVCVNAHGLGE